MSEVGQVKTIRSRAIVANERTCAHLYINVVLKYGLQQTEIICGPDETHKLPGV